jgi:nicotinamide-nucleotide amidase
MAEAAEYRVAKLLEEKGISMSTAESCTGGMVAARMVNVPGVSRVFTSGIVTYSNEAKRNLLGVREETLKAVGAVSPETAEEMARGGRKACGSDLCVSITGIAGPDGGTKEKPVGLVYMACDLRGHLEVRRYQFQGSRSEVREQSAEMALKLAEECLLKAE